MKLRIGQSILAVAAAALASTAVAQNPAPPQPNPQAPPPQQELPEVSESQLDTFTTIYVALQDLNTEFQAELAEVESEDEAVEVQARMQEASTELIEEHDWTLDRYNQVTRAINQQPEALERALELIDQKS